MPRYNRVCPAHEHTCWTHRHLMREDDLVCTADYKRLPQNFKTILWEIKREFKPVKLSMVVDWLREHPLEEDMECKDNA